MLVKKQPLLQTSDEADAEAAPAKHAATTPPATKSLMVRLMVPSSQFRSIFPSDGLSRGTRDLLGSAQPAQTTQRRRPGIRSKHGRRPAGYHRMLGKRDQPGRVRARSQTPAGHHRRSR